MPNDLKKIIWIVSYPKSGNTWFRVFLNNILSESLLPIDVNELEHAPICSNRIIFDKYVGTSASDLTYEEIRRLRPLVYKKIAEESSELLFFKVHDAWELTNITYPIFPPEVTKAVIYIIRNPLDIVVSLAAHYGISIDATIKKMNNQSNSLCSNPDKLYIQLQQNLYSWSDHVKSWLVESNLPVFVLMYEKMLTEPSKAFTDAINFIGLDLSSNKIKKAIQNSSFEILKLQEKSKGFHEKPITAGSFFREGGMEYYKSQLSPTQIKMIISNHKDIMKQFEYI